MSDDYQLDRAIDRQAPAGTRRLRPGRSSIRFSTPGWSATWDSSCEGQPFVIPTTYVRLGETVYVHGSPASRMLQTLERRCRGVRDGHAG